MAGHVGEDRVGAGGDHDRADGEAVEPVGQVDRIGRADDHERRERHVEQAEVGAKRLEERHGDLGR